MDEAALAISRNLVPWWYRGVVVAGILAVAEARVSEAERPLRLLPPQRGEGSVRWVLEAREHGAGRDADTDDRGSPTCGSAMAFG
jgi:hypothetical protein